MSHADYTGHDADCACWAYHQQTTGEAMCNCGLLGFGRQGKMSTPPTDSEMLDWLSGYVRVLPQSGSQSEPDVYASRRGSSPNEFRQSIIEAMKKERA